MADQGNEALLRVEDLRTWYPIKKGLLRKTVGHVARKPTRWSGVVRGHEPALAFA